MRDRVTILNRTAAQDGRFGLDSAGIEFTPAKTVWAEVTWAKGKAAMNAGSLDVYEVIMVRMRYNTTVTKRSRIMWQGETYQIIGETFHPARQDNAIQFHAQLIVKDKQ